MVFFCVKIALSYMIDIVLFQYFFDKYFLSISNISRLNMIFLSYLSKMIQEYFNNHLASIWVRNRLRNDFYQKYPFYSCFIQKI
jgi:hypothetical protein